MNAIASLAAVATIMPIQAPKPARPRGKTPKTPEMIDFYMKSNLHDRVIFGARDLQEHVEAITGARLAIVDDTKAPKGALVLIGRTKQTRCRTRTYGRPRTLTLMRKQRCMTCAKQQWCC